MNFVWHKTTRVEAGKQLALDVNPCAHMNRDRGFKEISGALHAAKLAGRESNCVRDVLTLSRIRPQPRQQLRLWNRSIGLFSCTTKCGCHCDTEGGLSFACGLLERVDPS